MNVIRNIVVKKLELNCKLICQTKNISLILKRVKMHLCMIMTDICKFRKHSRAAKESRLKDM